MFRVVPRTGVIYVTTEAQKRGFKAEDPDWANLGQGQPETSELPGAPPRVRTVSVDLADLEYGPVAGLWELREAVAGLYNALYRKGMGSRYSAENVCITGGGRVGLTRAVASLASVNVGHFLPDYTAYEELLDLFKSFTPIPILLEGEQGYRFSSEDLRREVVGRGLGAVLLSNPCNPTGRAIRGAELSRWLGVARECDCSLLIDEFYSHYLWAPVEAGAPVESAARYVENVDADPVVLLDGLTKNWRYPGWRLSWIVGPKAVIDAVSSAGSFLDGGGSRPLQRAALGLLREEDVLAEARAIHQAFLPKRDAMIEKLRKLGVQIDSVPEGTFYVWGNVAALPPPLNDGLGFFKAGLDRKVITVPGEFFDINPGKRRARAKGRFRSYVRFSFGPAKSAVDKGLERIEAMVSAARS